jgi:type I restriction enzyme S subunit
MAKLIEITGRALSGEWGMEDENGNGIPVLRTTNFTNEGTVNYSNIVTRIIEKKNIEEKFLRKGDIIIEKSGGSDKFPVGRVIYFDGEENIYLFNNFTGLLRVKNLKKWYPKYVFYSLFANYKRGGTRTFENKTTGLHNLKINDYVSRYEVIEISRNKQVAICEKLDKIHKIIRKKSEEMKLLDELIQSRFVELFGDPYVNPLKWKRLKIKDAVTIEPQNGLYKPQSDYVADGTGTPILRIDGFYNGRVTDFGSLKRLKCSGMEQQRYLLLEDDIVINRVNSIEYLGKCAHIKGLLEDTVYESNMMRMHFDPEHYNPVYICKLLCSQYIYDQIVNHAKKAVNQASINQKDVLDFNIYQPPLELQNQFADFVVSVDKSK